MGKYVISKSKQSQPHPSPVNLQTLDYKGVLRLREDSILQWKQKTGNRVSSGSQEKGSLPPVLGLSSVKNSKPLYRLVVSKRKADLAPILRQSLGKWLHGVPRQMTLDTISYVSLFTRRY